MWGSILSPVELKIDAALDFAAPTERTYRTLRTDAPPAPAKRPSVLPTASSDRKRTPLCTGLLDYAPVALAEIACAPLDEYPDPDAAELAYEDAVIDALGERDSFPALRSMTLHALAILHRELTGDPPPALGGMGVASLFAAYGQALAEVAQVSWYGNEKHNPGQPLHHARAKSTDHADCILRHLVDNMTDPGGYDGEFRHAAALVWRCLILLQLACEAVGSPVARGAK
jgi:hypothetical protein